MKPIVPVGLVCPENFQRKMTRFCLALAVFVALLIYSETVASKTPTNGTVGTLDGHGQATARNGTRPDSGLLYEERLSKLKDLDTSKLALASEIGLKKRIETNDSVLQQREPGPHHISRRGARKRWGLIPVVQLKKGAKRLECKKAPRPSDDCSSHSLEIGELAWRVDFRQERKLEDDYYLELWTNPVRGLTITPSRFELTVQIFCDDAKVWINRWMKAVSPMDDQQLMLKNTIEPYYHNTGHLWFKPSPQVNVSALPENSRLVLTDIGNDIYNPRLHLCTWTYLNRYKRGRFNGDHKVYFPQ